MTGYAPAAALALALVLCGNAWAGPPPTETLRDVVTAVNHLLGNPELQEKPAELVTAIRRVVNNGFDFREAAERALGREWHARTSTERDEFVRLFADVLERAYISWIASRANVHGGLAIRYLGESIHGNHATVLTMIASREGGEIPLQYRMIAHGDRWAVYDVLLDGISLVENYRAQFSRVIRRTSYRELVAQVKAKTSETPSASTAAGERTVRSEGDAAEAGREGALDVSRDVTVTGIASGTPPGRMAVATTTSYWIQVGAFRNLDAAGGLAARLLEQNFPVSIDAVAGSGGHRGPLLSRVRVGPFLDRAEAASKLRDLQTNGYQPFIALERE